MSTQSGALIIRPICAKLTHDTETFGRMDPYCVITIGRQRHRTVVAKSAGKFPNWEDQLSYMKTNEDTIKIEVWDKDTASADDLIGETTLAISTVISKPNYEEWVPLTYKGRKAGEIRLNIMFRPSGPPPPPPSVHGVPANMLNMGGHQYAPMPMTYQYPAQNYPQAPPYPQSIYPTLNPVQPPPMPYYPPQQVLYPPQAYPRNPPLYPNSQQNAPNYYYPQNPPQNVPSFYPYAPK
mmetsp:Transcript_3493/g.3242  ORF Transcript_3493/g.3242 Transcript_3493/m.3242 type:complete len:237 (+) Transcript_3493:19-729(+)